MQGGIILFAAILALIFDLSPWARIKFTTSAAAWSLLATLPLLGLLLSLSILRLRWIETISELLEQVLVPLFRNAPAGSVLLVSVLAGVGEELLFRGVVQDGLAGVIGLVPALLLSSVIFGLVHAVTPAYLVLATIMGIYLGLVYHHSGNLLVAMVVHALYDWVAIHYYLRRTRHKIPAPDEPND